MYDRFGPGMHAAPQGCGRARHPLPGAARLRGTVARSCGANTRLNGHLFADATLAAGDRLRIGPIDLEVVTPQESVTPTPTKATKPAATAAPVRLAERRHKDQAQLARQRTRKLIELVRGLRSESARLHEETSRQQTLRSQGVEDDRRRLAEEHQELASRLCHEHQQREALLREAEERLAGQTRELDEQTVQFQQRAISFERQTTELEERQAELQRQQDEFALARQSFDEERQRLATQQAAELSELNELRAAQAHAHAELQEARQILECQHAELVEARCAFDGEQEAHRQESRLAAARLEQVQAELSELRDCAG